MSESENALEKFRGFLGFSCTCEEHVRRRKIYAELYYALINFADSDFEATDFDTSIAFAALILDVIKEQERPEAIH